MQGLGFDPQGLGFGLGREHSFFSGAKRGFCLALAGGQSLALQPQGFEQALAGLLLGFDVFDVDLCRVNLGDQVEQGLLQGIALGPHIGQRGFDLPALDDQQHGVRIADGVQPVEARL